MSPKGLREQCRTFVYGNTHIANELITREMVDEAEQTVEAERKQ